MSPRKKGKGKGKAKKNSVPKPLAAGDKRAALRRIGALLDAHSVVTPDMLSEYPEDMRGRWVRDYFRGYPDKESVVLAGSVLVRKLAEPTGSLSGTPETGESATAEPAELQVLQGGSERQDSIPTAARPSEDTGNRPGPRPARLAAIAVALVLAVIAVPGVWTMWPGTRGGLAGRTTSPADGLSGGGQTASPANAHDSDASDSKPAKRSWNKISTPTWTVVVDSVKSRSTAEQVARMLDKAGYPAGTLYSSNYGSLRPGWWVAYSGEFGGRQEAREHASEINRSFPAAHHEAYARYVSGYKSSEPP